MQEKLEKGKCLPPKSLYFVTLETKNQAWILHFYIFFINLFLCYAFIMEGPRLLPGYKKLAF